MDADSKSLPPDYESTVSAAPPSYEEDAQPATLTMDGTSLLVNGQPTYSLTRSLTTLQQESTSIHLGRIEKVAPEKPDSSAPSETSTNLLFYLVHLVNAQYQKERPPYYATSNKPGTGNIVFDIQKKTLSKPEYKILLHHGTTASSDPLFTDKPTTILIGKAGLMGGKYSWTDVKGKTIAQEDQGSDKKPQLKITAPLRNDLRDALVAAWCLRVWSDVAESREAKKDGLERLTPAEGMSGMGLKWSKRTGGMAALGGAGGGGGC